jgi:hypothetical protein
MVSTRNEHVRPALNQRLRLLIKTPGAKRSFVPGEGETITITDKNGKELWSFKNPEGQGNPDVIIYDVQIDLLIEREFGHLCQKTWNLGTADPPAGTTPQRLGP